MEPDPRALVHEVLEAHGGARRWNSLRALEARITARGLLFALKRRPALKQVRVWASTRGPHFRFLDFPRPGHTGELIGDREVRIVGPGGEVISRRVNPRLSFRRLRRLLYWDDLDFLYFGGYATWNYLVTPFLFLREGFQFEVLEPAGGLLRLRAAFPADIPTHCRTQTFYFDRERLLRRLDYTAEVVGGWARAAHLCGEYRDFEGLRAPTRRRVVPRLWGSRLISGPALVALEIDGVLPRRGP